MFRGRLLAAIVALVALPSCSFLLDFSDPIADAGTAEDAGQADAADTCDLDEPNNVVGDATAVESGSRSSSLCPAGDVDMYNFDLDGATDLIVVLRTDADITITLTDALGSELREAPAVDGEARIEQTADDANVLAAGTYLIVVESAAGVMASYDIEFDGP